jgi:hypothetical protein
MAKQGAKQPGLWKPLSTSSVIRHHNFIYPLTSKEHDGSLCNLKNYIEKEAVHTLANTLLAHLTTRCFTLINNNNKI